MRYAEARSAAAWLGSDREVSAMQIQLKDYPQLQFIAWNRQKDDFIEEEEAFSLYERHWRWVEQASLSANERQLIERLTQVFGHGVLNV